MPLPVLPLFHPVEPENRLSKTTSTLLQHVKRTLRKLSADLKGDGPRSIVNLERAMKQSRALGH